MDTINSRIDKVVLEDLFLTIPTGTVDMRDDRIKESWSVDIDSFHLFKYPITQEIYRAVTKEKPSTFNGGRLPVETVSWLDAVIFCNRLSESLGKEKCYTIDLKTGEVALNSRASGIRLPTETEWQYCLSGGNY